MSRMNNELFFHFNIMRTRSCFEYKNSSLFFRIHCCLIKQKKLLRCILSRVIFSILIQNFICEFKYRIKYFKFMTFFLSIILYYMYFRIILLLILIERSKQLYYLCRKNGKIIKYVVYNQFRFISAATFGAFNLNRISKVDC